MNISVTDLGKKYQREWVFRHLNFSFEEKKTYAITGHNGSGKSTLLQILTGYFPATEGTITYQAEGKTVSDDAYFRYLDVVTPYLELIEEFTLQEFLHFHFKFKHLKTGMDVGSLLHKVSLEKEKDKLIKNFSSGMRQRLKLGLAFYSESPVCFLDEPTSNLDEKGIDWYLENVNAIKSNKLLIISSNQRYEYDFCDEKIHIPNYK